MADNCCNKNIKLYIERNKQMTDTKKAVKITEEIIELCEQIVNICSNNEQERTSSFEDNVNKQHYTITFPKCLPHKVQINGKLKDLQNLSHAEREAVRTQREIDKARERLYLHNKQKF